MSETRVIDLLGAPCTFCGYEGPGYWQSHTHYKDCPWYEVGGEDARTSAYEQRAGRKGARHLRVKEKDIKLSDILTDPAKCVNTVVTCPECEGTLMVTNLRTPSRDFLKTMMTCVTNGANVEHVTDKDVRMTRMCACGFSTRMAKTQEKKK